MSLGFLITSLIVVIAPGPGVLVTLTAGLSRGRRASLVAAFGCTLGILPHMIAAITGLAALLHASTLAFQALKYAGVAYLLYLAWTTWRERGALAIEQDPRPHTDRQVIVSAILINLLNPKLSIFFLAFLPQFVVPGMGSPIVQMLELSLIFMAMTFAVFALYGSFAASVRRHVISRPVILAWLRRTFALAFLALGARLVTAER